MTRRHLSYKVLLPFQHFHHYWFLLLNQIFYIQILHTALNAWQVYLYNCSNQKEIRRDTIQQIDNRNFPIPLLSV